jgi:cysteinylglycine-S-conjugate dipeptidase
MIESVAAAVDRVMPAVRADLERLILIPGVSAPGFSYEPLDRSAALTASLLSDCGLDARVVSADGRPAVLATRPGPPGAPTVLLYAHHDVQPPGSLEDWESDPFDPVERDGRLYARGAADDKAGVMVHVAALRAVGELPLGIAVFIEGEEEYGTGATPRLLAEHRSALAADVTVVADVGNWAVGVPAVTTTLRGHVTADVTVRALTHSVHSGMYGGVVPDAVTALCRLIATLHDPDGNVAVSGLRHGPSPAVEYDLDRLRVETGAIGPFLGTDSAAARLWSRPAVTILGMDVPSRSGARSALEPAASAIVSLRIAPDEDPLAAFGLLRAHLLAHVPWGVEVTVTRRGAAPGFSVDPSSPAQALMRDCLRDAWDGVEPVIAGSGGSIPLLRHLQELFPATAVVLTGVEDPDTRAHSPNESLHLGEFRRACIAEALFLTRLATAD